VITGHVYRVHTTLANPPKTKIVFCVGNWFLWFNTEARRRPAQMAVKAGEAPGISRDCHLDCGRINVFPPGELAAAEDMGACAHEFLSRVADEVENSATTLAALYRREVPQILRDHVKPKDKKTLTLKLKTKEGDP
jgi:hypothetical protein